MRIGVIIIFQNNDTELDISFLEHSNEQLISVEFCFVDNASHDNTLTLLRTIKDRSDYKISIVEIKKPLSKKVAERAGLRFMTNRTDLKYLEVVDYQHLKTKQLSIIDAIKSPLKVAFKH